MMPAPLTDAERALAASLFTELFDALAAIGGEPGGAVTRLALTPELAQAERWFDATAARLGMDVTVDRNGNRWAGGTQRAAIMTGSHLDTVPHGGRFDGALGVVCGLIAAHLVRRRGARRAVGVVAFADEEGGRFDTPTFGSRLMVGALAPDAVLERRDRAGVTLREALRDAGMDPDALGRDDESVGRIAAFVELHVEQGTLLSERGRPLGIGSAIRPHGRWRFDLTGEANHGGTTELDARRDPMIALAELIEAAAHSAREHGALATVGKLEVFPNASNSVAGRVSAWLDVRAEETDAVARVVEDVTGAVRARVASARVELAVSRESDVPRVRFAAELRERVAATLAERGLAPLPLDTGAGHDAGALAARVPTAMLFVRSSSGVSHSAAEAAAPADCLTGIAALAAVLEDLANDAPPPPTTAARGEGGRDAALA